MSKHQVPETLTPRRYADFLASKLPLRNIPPLFFATAMQEASPFPKFVQSFLYSSISSVLSSTTLKGSLAFGKIPLSIPRLNSSKTCFVIMESLKCLLVVQAFRF